MSSRSTRAQAEAAQRQHPKFRAFQDALAVALQAFERAREWPDLIKCLQRVNKVLDKYAHIEAVPMAVTVAKRLAQCLNPVLPGGVHLKTLETYRAIFDRIGSSRLVLDMSLYSSGLFPLLSYCSTRVRPVLLDLYERFYLPLGRELIPCLGGLILALLPGIEEVDGDQYQRVLKLLNRIRDESNPSLFMLAMWRCLMKCPTSRLAAVNYISVTIPKHPQRLLQYLPTKHEIAIEAIASTLHDENVLVQRGMFDILISHFPLTDCVFSSTETVHLVQLALPVLLRRETSVNRRFHSWVLSSSASSSDMDSDSDERVLCDKALELLVEALLVQMGHMSLVGEDAARPFNLARTLMERSEIRNSTFIEKISLSLIHYAHYYNEIAISMSTKQQSASPIFSEEEVVSQQVLKAAQSYFNQVDLDRVWHSLLTSVEHEFEPLEEDLDEDEDDEIPLTPSRRTEIAVNRIEVLGLVDFALDFLPVHYKQGHSSASEKAHSLVDTVLRGLFRLSWTGQAQHLTCAMRFLLKIQSRSELASSITSTSELEKECSHTGAFLRRFRLSLPNEIVGGAPICSSRYGLTLSDLSHDALSERFCDMDLTGYSYVELVKHTVKTAYVCSVDDIVLEAISWSFQVVFSFLSRVEDPQLVSAFFNYLMNFCLSAHHELACIGIETWIDILTKFDSVPRNACSVIAARLWQLLSVESSDCHFKVSQLLYRLQAVVPDVCESVIADAILHPGSTDYVEGYRRFATLWNVLGDVAPDAQVFPNALMLMMDALEDRRPPIRLVARTWLRESMPKLERILDPLCLILLDPSTFRITQDYLYIDVYDTRLVLYVLFRLNSIVLADHMTFMTNVIGRKVNPVLLSLFRRHQNHLNQSSSPEAETFFSDPADYLEVLVFTTLRFIQGTPRDCSNQEFMDENETVRASGVEYLKSIMAHIPVALSSCTIANRLADPILRALSAALQSSNSMMQVQLLGVLKIALIEGQRGGGDNSLCHSTIFTSTLLSGIQNAHREHAFHARVSSSGHSSITDESPSALPHWIWFTVTILPYLGKSLSSVAFSVISVLCEQIQKQQESAAANKMNISSFASGLGLLLQGLHGIVHYCLIDEEVSTRPEDVVNANALPASGVFGFLGGVFSRSDSRPSASPAPSPVASSLGSRRVSEDVANAVFEMLPVIIEAVLVAFHICSRDICASASMSSSALHDVVSAPSSVSAIREHSPISSSAVATTSETDAKPAAVTFSDSSRLRSVSQRLTRSPVWQSRTKPRTARVVSESTRTATGTGFVVSAALNWENRRHKLVEHCLALLRPLVHEYPARMMRAFLHAWEKELTHTSSQLHSNGIDVSDPVTSPQSLSSRSPRDIQIEIEGRERFLQRTASQARLIDINHIARSCPQHKIIIDLLNALEPATPDVVVGAIVPLAVSVLQNREHERNRSVSLSTSAMAGEMAPLKIHETAALHFLDSYLKQCTVTDLLSSAWSSLLVLMKEALQRSDHPFTFLWLLGMLQQYVHRSSVDKLKPKARKELREVTSTLLNTICLIAGRSVRFAVPDSRLVPLPSVVSFHAYPDDAKGDDVDELPPLPKWLDLDCKREDNIVVLASESANMSLVALRSLSNVLAVLLHDVWADQEKATSILAQNLPLILPVIDNRSVHNLPYVRAVVTLLASFSVSAFKHTLRSWKKEAWQHFQHQDFFKTDLESLEQWRHVIARIVSEDQSALNELMGRVSGAQAMIFTSHKTDVIQRTRQLKRLSYVIHSGRIDQYSRHLPTIIEKLVESLKMEDASSLYAAVLFCIRVLVARVSPEHLTPIWPVVLMEIIRVFDECDEPELVLEACKFVDIALVLLPSQFQLYQWMFVVDRAARFQMRSKNGDDAADSPAERSQDVSDSDLDVDEQHANVYRSFQPHLRVLSTRLSGDADHDDRFQRHPSLSELNISLADRALRRPVLPCRRLGDLSQLLPFHMALSRRISESALRPAPPDLIFVDRMLLADFVEYGDEYPDTFDMRLRYVKDARPVCIKRAPLVPHPPPQPMP